MTCKNSFAYYVLYYYIYFCTFQDDLLINLVIEQMINDPDPGKKK